MSENEIGRGAEGGAAVDSEGRAAPDPTKNVLDLVHAAIRRQDDLRKAEFKRQDDLRMAEVAHRAEIEALRWKYDTELRSKETERIDSIRAVDVAAVQQAAQVQATQAGALAAQVVATADAFRVSLAAALEPIIKDIADLRKTQYEQAGQKAQHEEQGIGSRAWIAIAATVLIGGGSLLLGIAAIVISIIIRSKGGG